MLAKFENQLRVNRSNIPQAVQNQIDSAGMNYIFLSNGP